METEIYKKFSIRRIRRMLKHFKNKPIHILYQYENSLKMFREYNYNGIYDRFTIREPFPGNCIAVMYKDNKSVFEQEFDINWWFTGLGKLQFCNDGPYCYFTIKRV